MTGSARESRISIKAEFDEKVKLFVSQLLARIKSMSATTTQGQTVVTIFMKVQ